MTSAIANMAVQHESLTMAMRDSLIMAVKEISSTIVSTSTNATNQNHLTLTDVVVVLREDRNINMELISQVSRSMDTTKDALLDQATNTANLTYSQQDVLKIVKLSRNPQTPTRPTPST